MSEPEWRPGVATRCGRCLSRDLESREDGSVLCRVCGAVTASWTDAAHRDVPPPMSVGGRPPPPPAGTKETGEPDKPKPKPKEPRPVRWTRWGLLFLMGAAGLIWIPVVGLGGAILAFPGVAFLFLGRKPFGAAHARNVMFGILLAGVAGLLWLVVAFMLGAARVAAFATTTANPGVIEALEGAYTTQLLGGIGIAALVGLAAVLWTFAMHDKKGQLFLWITLGITVIVAAGIYVAAAPNVAPAVAAAFAAGRFDPGPVNGLQGTIIAFGIAYLFPAILFISVFTQVSDRIKSGDLPAKPAMRPGRAAASGTGEA